MFLNSPRRKLFLYGTPASGKTTLLEFLYLYLKGLPYSYRYRGFLTKEVRVEGKRVGFELCLLNESNLKIPLAAKKNKIEKKQKLPTVGSYVVWTENLSQVVSLLEKELENISKNHQIPFLLIDEIGKMEILCKTFVDFIKKILEAPIWLASTLGYGESSFLKSLHQFPQALFCKVTPENRDFLKERLKVEFERKGKLIVIEGIDGAGKTTLAKALYSSLKKRAIPCLLSFEPTYGPLGKKIRPLLENKKASEKELLALFLEDRIWHVKEVILPALNQGKWIILDRYYLSTVAYQGAQGLKVEEILKENETIAPLPDLVIFLKISPEKAISRIKDRKNLIFFENSLFLERVSQIYQAILSYFNFLELEATLSLETLLKITLNFLDKDL
ncbi:MAG: dTMP kinase [Thermodesulfobacteriaceae bacterium]|nr:dTMP kinase [Thermodesulfobacteriaceae bacterium]